MIEKIAREEIELQLDQLQELRGKWFAKSERRLKLWLIAVQLKRMWDDPDIRPAVYEELLQLVESRTTAKEFRKILDQFELEAEK